MTDMQTNSFVSEASLKRLKKRHAAERRFRFYGMAAIGIAMAALAVLVLSIGSLAFSASTKHYVEFELELDPAVVAPGGVEDTEAISRNVSGFYSLVRANFAESFPEAADDRALRKDLSGLVTRLAVLDMAKKTAARPARIGQRVTYYAPLSDDLDLYLKGKVSADAPESLRNVSDQQIAWVLALQRDGRIKRRFNMDLLSKADSTYPELAGTLAAIVGSMFTMIVTALIAIPVGICAAVYLEEYAPKNRLTEFIEVNINNLAAVPSIVFGLLGAAVFLKFFGMPRSAPLVGGIVLGLLTLPTIIIASRASLKSVPDSIRNGALAVGASETQSVFHHVLPLAGPGILTGSIIGMARALGETAPLLLIGMVAFVAEVPNGPGDESTVLPVLIYKWATNAERAWEPMTAAAIIVLLVFMILMNVVAVMLRKRFERRW